MVVKGKFRKREPFNKNQEFKQAYHLVRFVAMAWKQGWSEELQGCFLPEFVRKYILEINKPLSKEIIQQAQTVYSNRSNIKQLTLYIKKTGGC